MAVGRDPEIVVSGTTSTTPTWALETHQSDQPFAGSTDTLVEAATQFRMCAALVGRSTPCVEHQLRSPVRFGAFSGLRSTERQLPSHPG